MLSPTMPPPFVTAAVGAAVRLTTASVAGTEAALRLPAVALRLVVRLDQLAAAAIEVGGEVGPPLRRLVPVLDELAALLAEGAPLLRRLLPLIEAATPALEELTALAGDGAPVLRRLVPVLETLDPTRLGALVGAADRVIPELARTVSSLPPDLGRRLLDLLAVAEAELPALGVVGDTSAGLAAVTANTDHLVAMLDDLYAQLRAIPGTGALLRRGRRRSEVTAAADPASSS